jgi:hypothetical protein
MRERTRGKSRTQWLPHGILALAVAGLALAGFDPSLVRANESTTPTMLFHDVKQQTREFHAYNRSINLTAEQRSVMRQGLAGLRAPCCSDRTAATCCCPCNMAKAWWGLAKYLIAERGYGPDQVRETVADWIHFINPEGFTGNACYTGGCDRPFHDNGCGGMDESRVRY